MFQYYHIAVVLLADIMIDLGLSKSSQWMMEEVLPQVGSCQQSCIANDLRCYRSCLGMTSSFAFTGAWHIHDVLWGGASAGGSAFLVHSMMQLNVVHSEINEQVLKEALKDYQMILKYDKALEALYILSMVCRSMTTWPLKLLSFHGLICQVPIHSSVLVSYSISQYAPGTLKGTVLTCLFRNGKHQQSCQLWEEHPWGVLGFLAEHHQIPCPQPHDTWWK